MNLIDATFPYPVLTPGKNNINYGVCEVSAVLLPGEDEDRDFIIECNFDIDDNCIKSYIENGYAVYAIEASCPTTYFRKVATSKNSQISFPIPKSHVKGDVSVNLTICIIKKIENYINPNFHSAFKDEVFTLEPGMLLANFGTKILHSDFDYERLSSSSSIIRIEDADEHFGSGRNTYTYIDLDSDFITICLSHAEFEHYTEISRNMLFLEIFHASFVQKALLLAILNLKKYKDEQYTWVRVIKYYLDHVKEFEEYKTMLEDDTSESLSLQASQELTQAILGNPDKRLIDNMIKQQDAAAQIVTDED